MQEIELTDGTFCQVDDEDYEYLNQFSWGTNTTKRGDKEYVYVRVNNALYNGLLMHRMIMGLTEGDTMVVDHIDSDGRNNQKSNLRVITNADNIRRQDARNPLGVKGVKKLDRLKSKPYRCECRLNNKSHHLGYFATVEEAVIARSTFLRENGVVLL